MFYGNLEPPKYVEHSKPNPMTYDIQLPTGTPGVYGHMGRSPNTNYHARLLEHRQHLRDADAQFLAGEAKRLLNNTIQAKYDQHFAKYQLKRNIEDRFKEKVKAYEETVEKRRQKLQELLRKEEEEHIWETIQQAQKGTDSRMEDMKQQAQLLRAQREAERLEVVKRKRHQQFITNSQELRTMLYNQNHVQSKNAQLEQIRERRMREEAEKELDSMWHDLMLKEVKAKMEREANDLLKQNRTRSETVEVWQKQLQGKELLKQEIEKLAMEDRIEMEKLQEQLRREKIEALDSQRRKRDQMAKELREQIAIQERFLAQRKEEEDTFTNAMNSLALSELKREKSEEADTTRQAKREMAIYRNHLKELEEERKKEERELDCLLEEHRKLVEKKREEAYCKAKWAREELQKKVLAERGQQLEYKRIEAENQLKMKEAENELMRMMCETNERLQSEHDRLQAEAVRQYREDLRRQIAENDEKRKLEREQLRLELAEGLAEEERQRRHVQDLINARLEDKSSFQHPFTRVLEKSPCPCPTH